MERHKKQSMSRRLSKTKSHIGRHTGFFKRSMILNFGNFSIEEDVMFFLGSEKENREWSPTTLKYKFNRVEGLNRKNSKRFKQLFT